MNAAARKAALRGADALAPIEVSRATRLPLDPPPPPAPPPLDAAAITAATIAAATRKHREGAAASDGSGFDIEDDLAAPDPSRRRADAGETVPPLVPITAAALLGMSIPTRQMALAPILPLPGLAMLYGPRGMGKTFAALSIAYAMAAGGDAPALRWRAPAPRRIIYLDGEMPAGALQERLADIVRGAGVMAPPDNLRFVCADLLPEGLPSIARPAMQRALFTAATDADVVILDNLSALAGGLRENEADDWQPIQTFLMALRRAGKHVLLVHHAGKGGQQRGTSRREDVLDTVIALRRPVDYEPDQGARVEVHLEKARGLAGPEASPFEARLIAAPDGGLTWAVTDLRDANRHRAETLLAEGLSIRDVAEETGLTRSAVHRLKKAAGRGGDA